MPDKDFQDFIGERRNKGWVRQILQSQLRDISRDP
jgi:hypothetical protein